MKREYFLQPFSHQRLASKAETNMTTASSNDWIATPPASSQLPEHGLWTFEFPPSQYQAEEKGNPAAMEELFDGPRVSVIAPSTVSSTPTGHAPSYHSRFNSEDSGNHLIPHFRPTSPLRLTSARKASAAFLPQRAPSQGGSRFVFPLPRIGGRPSAHPNGTGLDDAPSASTSAPKVADQHPNVSHSNDAAAPEPDLLFPARPFASTNPFRTSYNRASSILTAAGASAWRISSLTPSEVEEGLEARGPFDLENHAGYSQGRDGNGRLSTTSNLEAPEVHGNRYSTSSSSYSVQNDTHWPFSQTASPSSAPRTPTSPHIYEDETFVFEDVRTYSMIMDAYSGRAL